MYVLGMISGTSFDAIELAVGDFALDGDRVHGRLVAERSWEMPRSLREEIEAVLPPHPTTAEAICRLDTHLGHELAAAAAAVADGLPGPLELIASAGQTVYHWVDGDRALGTLQLGQPAWIAERTGVPVLSDLRASDVAAGGHGAPMASLLDVLLLGDRPHAVAALNLGGIANITVVRPDADPVAYDTGPANALLDAAVRAQSGGVRHYDDAGAGAARGAVDHAALARLIDDEPYYALPAPKSTGKELFHPGYLAQRLGDELGRLDSDDLLATLTALTVETVARELERHGVAEAVVSGGGVRNDTMMTSLRDRLPGVAIAPFESVGVPSTAKEAFTFALAGFLSASGRHATVASCTGARGERLVGTLQPPSHAGAVAARPRRLVLAEGL